MNDKLKIILQQDSSAKTNKKIDDITKKIQKIEKLNEDVKNLKTKIKTIQLQVDTESAEQKIAFCKAKEEYIIMLAGKYALKSLTKWQKDILGNMITEEYQILTDFEYETDELNEAFARYIDLQNNDMNAYEMQLAQELTADMMAELGITDDFDYSKMNDPRYKKDFEEKVRQQQNKTREDQKVAEKIAQVSTTDIDLQKVYKKLCKKVHPDLYKNESEKAIREEQMQRLTKIWEERNYYELLMLWLEIDPENTIELQLTEENQNNLLKQLNTKIKAQESEIYRLKFHYKDTSFYYRNFNAANPKTVAKKIAEYVHTLEENTVATIKERNNFLNTANLKKHFQAIYMEDNKENNFEDFLTMFGSKFD